MDTPNGFACNLNAPIFDGKNLITMVTFSYPMDLIKKGIPSGTTFNISFDGHQIITNVSSLHPLNWNNIHALDENSNEEFKILTPFTEDINPPIEENNVLKAEIRETEKKSYSKIASETVEEVHHEKVENTVILTKIIPDNFSDMIQSMKNKLSEFNIEEIQSMSFLDEKNKRIKYVTYNTTGLIHSFLISLNWKYKQIPSWVIANCKNMTGFIFDRCKYDDFIISLKEKGYNYSRNYFKKFLEVIPYLKKILESSSERRISINYKSFFADLSKYQLCYFCSMVGVFYEKEDTKESLIEKIYGATEEINTLNKVMFQIVVLTSNEFKSKVITEEPK